MSGRRSTTRRITMVELASAQRCWRAFSGTPNTSTSSACRRLRTLRSLRLWQRMVRTLPARPSRRSSPFTRRDHPVGAHARSPSLSLLELVRQEHTATPWADREAQGSLSALSRRRRLRHLGLRRRWLRERRLLLLFRRVRRCLLSSLPGPLCSVLKRPSAPMKRARPGGTPTAEATGRERRTRRVTRLRSFAPSSPPLSIRSVRWRAP